MKKRKSLVLIALLLLVGLTSGYVASTYAKYTSTITGSKGTATVAKWAFDTENTSKTYEIKYLETYDKSTLVNGKIAPGTKGSFDIALSNKTSDVGVKFEIALGTATNKPTNLKFCKDAACTQELTPGTGKITGKIAQGEELKDTTAVKVYWAWEYSTSDANDETDTTEGKAAQDVTLNLTITGTQVEPGTAITTGLDA